MPIHPAGSDAGNSFKHSRMPLWLEELVLDPSLLFPLRCNSLLAGSVPVVTTAQAAKVLQGVIVPTTDVVTIRGNLFAASSIGKNSNTAITVTAKALAAKRAPVRWKRFPSVRTFPTHRRRSPLRVAATKSEKRNDEKRNGSGNEEEAATKNQSTTCSSSSRR